MPKRTCALVSTVRNKNWWCSLKTIEVMMGVNKNVCFILVINVDNFALFLLMLEQQLMSAVIREHLASIINSSLDEVFPKHMGSMCKYVWGHSDVYKEPWHFKRHQLTVSTFPTCICA